MKYEVEVSQAVTTMRGGAVIVEAENEIAAIWLAIYDANHGLVEMRQELSVDHDAPTIERVRCLCAPSYIESGDEYANHMQTRQEICA